MNISRTLLHRYILLFTRGEGTSSKFYWFECTMVTWLLFVWVSLLTRLILLNMSKENTLHINLYSVFGYVLFLAIASGVFVYMSYETYGNNL